MPDHAPGCESCMALLRQETGYSHDTITGQSVECLLRANPHMPFETDDQSNQEMTAAISFGETCHLRQPGTPVWLNFFNEGRPEEVVDEITKSTAELPGWQALLVFREFEIEVPPHLAVQAAVADTLSGSSLEQCQQSQAFIENFRPLPKSLATRLLLSTSKPIRLQAQAYLAVSGIQPDSPPSPENPKRTHKR